MTIFHAPLCPGLPVAPHVEADTRPDEDDGLAVGVIPVGVGGRPDGLTHADPVDRVRRRARRGCRRRGSGLPCRGRGASRRKRARLGRMATHQLSVVDARAIDGPARSHRIGGPAFAAAVLKHQLVAFHADPGERRRMGTAVEETAGELVAVLRHLEPIDLVGVRAGSREVPASDKRVLLTGDDGRGSDEQSEQRDLHAHDCTLCVERTRNTVSIASEGTCRSVGTGQRPGSR